MLGMSVSIISAIVSYLAFANSTNSAELSMPIPSRTNPARMMIPKANLASVVLAASAIAAVCLSNENMSLAYCQLFATSLTLMPATLSMRGSLPAA